jgi:hypothetical protein
VYDTVHVSNCTWLFHHQVKAVFLQKRALVFNDCKVELLLPIAAYIYTNAPQPSYLPTINSSSSIPLTSHQLHLGKCLTTEIITFFYRMVRDTTASTVMAKDIMESMVMSEEGIVMAVDITAGMVMAITGGDIMEGLALVEDITVGIVTAEDIIHMVVGEDIIHMGTVGDTIHMVMVGDTIIIHIREMKDHRLSSGA